MPKWVCIIVALILIGIGAFFIHAAQMPPILDLDDIGKDNLAAGILFIFLGLAFLLVIFGPALAALDRRFFHRQPETDSDRRKTKEP
jgi:hypothetical protein